MNPLIIGAAQREQLRALREQAAADPIDMRGLKERIATPDGKQAHMTRMNARTVDLPVAYCLTFSIEIGHPGGTARHMSMSSDRRGKTPTPEAVWMVCQELGFVGGFEHCWVWMEDLQRGPDATRDRAKAVNVVQLLSVVAAPESEPDTSDIPEAGEDWFARAKLRRPQH